MANSWEKLNIPDAWTATAMLRNMVVDHLSPGESIEGLLDDETRSRMVGLAVMGHIELADKTARLVEQFQALIGEVGDLADRSNALREAVVKLAELIDNQRGS